MLLNTLVCGPPSVKQHTLKTELDMYVNFSCQCVQFRWRRSMGWNVQK